MSPISRPTAADVDLFAWLTLASMDETSFVDADAQAVAGRLNRTVPERDYDHDDDDDDYDRSLELHCWPWGSTSDIPSASRPSSPEMVQDQAGRGRAMGLMDDNEGMDIVVTASVIARQEELGDLKLYRIPVPVTVAARSQKQVAFLERSGIRTRLVYRHRLSPRSEGDDEQSERVLMLRNRREDGLGVPLPAGSLPIVLARRQWPPDPARRGADRGPRGQ